MIGQMGRAGDVAGEPMAAAMAAQARASSRPCTMTVASVSALGSTFTVMSVMAASVPQEPANTLHMS